MSSAQSERFEEARSPLIGGGKPSGNLLKTFLRVVTSALEDARAAFDNVFYRRSVF